MIPARKLLSYSARMVLLISIAVAASLGLAPVHRGMITPDKAEHAGWFFWLAVVAAAAFPKLKLRWISLALILTGVGAELFQFLFRPLRGVTIGDVLANTTGVAFAAIALGVGKYRTNLRLPGA